jgi:trehalose/maltose hydrolase-like predicted phosphorylase
MKIDSARATARKDTSGHVQYPWRTALRVQESTLGSTATTDIEEEAKAWIRSQISKMTNNDGGDV